MSQVDLWLIRHGETEVNSGVWSAKPNETNLTSKGREQAKASASQVTTQPDLIIVSPLIRALETSEFLRIQWPQAPVLLLPIQEFNYLSPQKLNLLTPEERTLCIKDYWLRDDPYYCDDSHETETFASFLMRVNLFYQELLKQKGYIVAIGHGQFFKAFMLGLEHGFELTPNWMSFFRNQERLSPIKNGEIIKCQLEI